MEKYHKGQTVYRSRWDKIEIGRVTEVERCSFGSNSSGYPDPNGNSWMASAEFQGDYVSQTSDHRFFATRREALFRLVYDAHRQIEEATSELKKWTKVASDAASQAQYEQN